MDSTHSTASTAASKGSSVIVLIGPGTQPPRPRAPVSPPVAVQASQPHQQQQHRGSTTSLNGPHGSALPPSPVESEPDDVHSQMQECAVPVPTPIKISFLAIGTTYFALMAALLAIEGKHMALLILCGALLFSLLWAYVRWCGHGVSEQIADIVIILATAVSSTSIFYHTNAVLNLAPIALVPLGVQRCHFAKAALLAHVVMIVAVALAASGTVIQLGNGLQVHSTRLVFLVDAALLLGTAGIVHLFAHYLLGACCSGTAAAEALLALGSARGSSNQLISVGAAGAAAGRSPSANSQAAAMPAQVESATTVFPALAVGSRPRHASNPLLPVALEIDGELLPTDVELMSAGDKDPMSPTDSQTLSPITLSPMPTPRGTELVLSATTPVGGRVSSGSDSTGRVSYTPTRNIGSRRGSRTLLIAPSMRFVALLCLTVRRRGAGSPGPSAAAAAAAAGGDARAVFEEFLATTVQDAAIDRGGTIVPHVDTDVILVAWGAYGPHENPCFAAIQTAIHMQSRLALRGLSIHGGVVAGRMLCGTFGSLPGQISSHFRLVGSVLRDALALVDVAAAIDSPCVVDETTMIRVGDHYTSRPVDLYGSPSAPRTCHEILMPLYSAFAPASAAFSEWHLTLGRREQMTQHFGKFIAAFEAFAGGNVEQAELLLRVYLDEVPNDRAAPRLLQKVVVAQKRR